jgi:hypothetical protein
MRSWSAAPKRPPRPEPFALFKRWKRAMKSHEGYEESKLYPYLHARYGVSMSILELHHQQLGLADEKVHSAFAAGDALKFAHALKKHDEILVPHLAQEEEMVIPLLLSLTPREFERFTNGNIRTLLRNLERDAKEAESNG